MHTPIARLVLSLLIAVPAHTALAQDAGKVPGLDESKIPDWIKRQAASPQKAILSTAAPKPKTEVVPVRVGRVSGRRLPPLAMEATAAGPAVQTVAQPAAAEPAPALGTAAAPAALGAAVGPALADVPTGLTQPVPGAAEPAPVAPAPTEPAPPPNLELIERSDPVLTADLIDSRLAEASVTVAFTVGTRGEVIAPQIVASTDRRLNRAVLRAVADWRYAPVSEPRPHSVKFSFAVQQ